jgi:hypothetical protein
MDAAVNKNSLGSFALTQPSVQSLLLCNITFRRLGVICFASSMLV